MADRLRFDIDAESGDVIQVFRVIETEGKERFEEIVAGKYNPGPEEGKGIILLKAVRPAGVPAGCRVIVQDGKMWVNCPETLPAKVKEQ